MNIKDLAPFQIKCLEAYVKIMKASEKGTGCRLSKEQCAALALSDMSEPAEEYRIAKKEATNGKS